MNDINKVTSNTTEQTAAPAPKRTQRKPGMLRLGLLLLLLLVLVSCLCWGWYKVRSSGEVTLPLPDTLAQTVTDNFTENNSGRIGPVRIGSFDDAKLEVLHELDKMGLDVGELPVEAARSAVTDSRAHTSSSGRAMPSTATIPPADAFMGGQPLAGRGVDAKGSSITLEGSTQNVTLQDQNAANQTDPNTADSRTNAVYAETDTVVTPLFVADLAKHLVENYWAKGTHPNARYSPYSSTSLKAINQRYGVNLKGLGSYARIKQRDEYRERGQVLYYVFMPSMLNALTHMYAEPLADEMAHYANSRVYGSKNSKRSMTDAEKAEMFRFYADYAAFIGYSLNAYYDDPKAIIKVDKLQLAEQNVYKAHLEWLTERERLEQHEAQTNAEQAKNSTTSEIGATPATRLAQNVKPQSNGRQNSAPTSWQEDDTTSTTESAFNPEAAPALALAYQQSLLRQQDARKTVLKMMTRGKISAENLANADNDPQGLIYMARWLARRGEDNKKAINAAAEAVKYTAGVLQQKAIQLEAR